VGRSSPALATTPAKSRSDETREREGDLIERVLRSHFEVLRENFVDALHLIEVTTRFVATTGRLFGAKLRFNDENDRFFAATHDSFVAAGRVDAATSRSFHETPRFFVATARFFVATARFFALRVRSREGSVCFVLATPGNFLATRENFVVVPRLFVALRRFSFVIRRLSLATAHNFVVRSQISDGMVRRASRPTVSRTKRATTSLRDLRTSK
jgi:hypothetical protein